MARPCAFEVLNLKWTRSDGHRSEASVPIRVEGHGSHGLKETMVVNVVNFYPQPIIPIEHSEIDGRPDAGKHNRNRTSGCFDDLPFRQIDLGNYAGRSEQSELE